MRGILQHIEHHSGDDHQKRLMLSFDDLFGEESGTALGRLFDYWCSVASDGVIDDDGQFRPNDILPADMARWVSWVDTRSASPLDYVWRDHIYAWQGEVSDLFRDASGIRIRDYGFERHGRFCSTEYHLCRGLKRPFYHEIEQWTGSIHRHYRRLLLPVQNARGEVNRIVYVCRRL